MKKTLLFVLMCVCATINAWALMPGNITGDGFEIGEHAGKWNNQGKVVVIHITETNGLANALTKLQNTINEVNDHGDPTPEANEYKEYTMLRIESANDVTLSDDDITALNAATVTAETIDMQNLQTAAQTSERTNIALTNSTVKNLILPDGWNKTAVNTAAQGCSNLGAAFSMGTVSELKVTNNGQEFDAASITAYVKKPGTLYDAINHSYYTAGGDGGQLQDNTKLRASNQGIGSYYELTLVRVVTISGTPSARDFSGPADDNNINFDADGHFVFNEPAVEAMEQSRTLVGTSPGFGALRHASIVSLDLEDAVLPSDDLTMGYTGIFGDWTKQIIIPTDPSFDTLPADFLNCAHAIGQICIPGNIKNIKTRAFKGSHTIDHIWTTNSNNNLKTDNGIVTGFDSEGKEIFAYGHLGLNSSKDHFLYGTYTLPADLELIESYAFGTNESDAPHVKDVYVLNPIAPECHVNAFHPVMYNGNNGFNTGRIGQDGIVTREVYCNDPNEYTWITMLHYPNETVTPNIQRYVDVTREYTVASGEVDGRGSTIYYPTQCEVDRAYQQGTTGYLWNAWDPERNDDGSTSFLKTTIDRYGINKDIYVLNADGQRAANDVYLANNNADVADVKPYTSFYDVTYNGLYNQPTGLIPYDQVKWDENSYSLSTTTGEPLYPAAVLSASYKKYVAATNEDISNGATLYVKNTDGTYTEYTGSIDPNTTYYTCLQRQVVIDGVPQYEECSVNAKFVKDYRYEKSSTGEYVRNITVTNNENGQWVKDYSYVANAQGQYYHPFVKDNNPSLDNLNKYYYYNSNEDTYVADDNGLYIKKSDVNQGDGYVLASNAQNWWGNQYNISQLQHYTLTHKWYKCASSNDYYNHANHPGVWMISDNYAVWSSNATDYEYSVADARTRYNKVYADPVDYREYNASTDAGETRYDVTIGNPEYITYVEGDEGQRYAKVEYYREATGGETATHCAKMEDALFYDVIKANDYRGWHQFVLTGYSHNSKLEFEPLKSYITDSDWWTVCAPYDLRYSDMVLLFGDKENNKIPYLSKLLYVVRDVENQKITLMFSKNLMEYMEHEPVDGGNSIVSINDYNEANMNTPVTYIWNGNSFTMPKHHSHGVIDDEKWPTENLGQGNNNPIIMHRGVPYLIKPYLKEGASRQFNIYKEQQAEGLTMPDGAIKDDWLYNSLKTSRNLKAGEQIQIIYNGEYQVPAYVINNTSTNGEGTLGNENPLTITMNDNSEFTYGNNSSFAFKNGTYDMKVSDDFTYTFVGSFYKSLMPQYCYFLGWDAKRNNGNGGAAFWYNRKNDLANYTWNNETGIICANWSLAHTITPADSKLTPAQWKAAGSGMGSDDFAGSVSSPAKKNYMDMEFGNIMELVYFSDVYGIATNVQEVPSIEVTGDGVVYDIHGVRVGTSLYGLPKGVYIVNGKKYVVK